MTSPTLPRSDRDATLVEATDLLNVELPDRRWADESHLRWLYHENPYGDAFYGFRRSGERLDAHYAVIPQEYRTPKGPMRMVFSLNAVTRSVAQRQGHFWSIAEEIYARCEAEYGAHGVIGVSNDNSTPPVVKRLNFRLLGPLPVKVVLPGRPAGAEHIAVDRVALGRGELDHLMAGLDHPVDWGWRNGYTADYLRWRLAPPNTEPFHLHASDDLVAVSVRSHLGPIPAAVVVKLMPRHDTQGRPVDANPIVSAICRYHRAPFAVHAGFNARVRLLGVRPPRRLQPSPLNLIYRSLRPDAPKEGFRLETFEFLDMDAY